MAELGRERVAVRGGYADGRRAAHGERADRPATSAALRHSSATSSSGSRRWSSRTTAPSSRRTMSYGASALNARTPDRPPPLPRGSRREGPPPRTCGRSPPSPPPSANPCCQQRPRRAGSLGQLRNRLLPLGEERLLDAFGTRECADRQQQSGGAFRPRGVRHLHRRGRAGLVGDDPGLDDGVSKEISDRSGHGPGEVEARRHAVPRWWTDDPAVHELRAPFLDDARDLPGRHRGDGVGIDVDAVEARDRLGDGKRPVRWAHGEDDVARLRELLDRPHVAQARLLGALHRLRAATRGRPEHRASSAQLHRERRTHLAGVQQPDDPISHASRDTRVRPSV